MKQVSEMPTSGRFVAVMQIGFDIYCQTYNWNLVVLHSVNNNGTEDKCGEFVFHKLKEVGATFFIAD